MPFVKVLFDEGYCVLLFDNRDIGPSQLMRDAKMPNVALQFVKYKMRDATGSQMEPIPP